MESVGKGDGKSINFALFSYCGQNPIGFIDPDGKELKPYTLMGKNTYLDDKFSPKVEKWIETAHSKGVDLHFNEAFRGPGDQEIIKNNPNSITPANEGESLHEAGFATDVNYKYLPKDQQKIIKDAAKDAGIDWGGNFAKKDIPHFYSDPGGNRKELVKSAQTQYREITRIKEPQPVPSNQLLQSEK